MEFNYRLLLRDKTMNDYIFSMLIAHQRQQYANTIYLSIFHTIHEQLEASRAKT